MTITAYVHDMAGRKALLALLEHVATEVERQAVAPLIASHIEQ